MAKNRSDKKLVWPSLLVALLALVWMAHDAGYIQCPFNPGPFAVLAAALALLINEYKNVKHK